MLRRRRSAQAHLVEIVSPRQLEEGELTARGLFAGLAGGEPCSLEIAVAGDGPRHYIRASSAEALGEAVAQLAAAYPQAEVEPIALSERPDLDPLRLGRIEYAEAVEPSPRDSALTLNTDLRGRPDALAGVLAAAAEAAGPGQRCLLQLALAPLPSGWAERLRSRVESPRAWREDDRRGPIADLLPLLALLALGAAGLIGYRWYEQGRLLELAAAGGVAVAALPFAAFVAARLAREPGPLSERLVEQKLGAPLLAARLRVVVIGPRRVARKRLRGLAMRVAGAYHAFDGSSGAVLQPREVRLGGSWQPAAGTRNVLNAHELAALWHLPAAGDGTSGVRRTRARRLSPPPDHAVRGCRIGASAAGGGVFLPHPLLHRNHLVVAKTRRGKSTLLRHIAADLMARQLVDPDAATLVVVDPHQDLPEAVLHAVPERLEERVVYLDFAHRERPVGLNLLDVELFRDRDRTTEHVITMMNRLWPANWGPRMEGALRASVASLLELNRELPRERQHTLLDVAALLMNAGFRADVLEQLHDPALEAWWRDNYNRLNRQLQQQTANPVTTKIGRFIVTEVSRLVLGQARSTFDPRMVLREGGTLVINTAAGSLGEGASALTGATLINLIGLMVEEQVALPLAERRRVVVLVDESSTLGAIDYTRMLSELMKYGASFVLVTQGLAKLDAVDHSLVPTIFSNIDALTTFQVSAEDARRLVPELGGELEVEDLTGLDDFECYARWWDGRARPAAFSFRVDPPPHSGPERAATIAARSAARYGRPRAVVGEEIALALETQGAALERDGPRRRRSADELAEAANAVTASSGRVDPPQGAAGKKSRGRAQRRGWP